MVVGDVTTGTDVLIIGAGPAGYVAAIRAGQLDLDVTLVEKDAYGGTCLNYGCIPSKALITATDVAHEAATAEEMGIHADPAIDLAGMMDWKDGVVDQLTSGGVEKLCKANQVNLLEGTARFADENTVRVSHSRGGSGLGDPRVRERHRGDRFAPHLDSRLLVRRRARPELATGARARFRPRLDGRRRRGYIGMELASVFAKLGTDVTVVEMLDSILPGYDDDLTRPVKQRAEALGIDFHFGYTASEWYEPGDGIRVVAEPVDGAAANGEAPRRSKRNASSSMSRTSS